MFTRLARSVWLLPVLVMAAGSCRKPTPPAPPPAVPTAQPSPQAPTAVALPPAPPAPPTPPPPAEAARAPERLALTQETTAAPGVVFKKEEEGVSRETPTDLATVPGGVLRAWAVPAKDEEAKSDLFAVQEDDKGRAVGPTTLIRRTSGKVVSVLVATTDGQPGEPDVWIGWMSAVPAKRADGESEKNSWLVATLRTTPTLSRVTRPITIAYQSGRSSDGIDQYSCWMLGVVPSRGGLAVSYALGYDEDSRGLRHVSYVSPDGQVRALGELRVGGGDGGGGTIIDLGSGVLATAMAQIGGPAWDTKYFPFDPGSKASKLKHITCDGSPPIFYFTGQEVVTLCSAENLSAADSQLKSCPLRQKDPEDPGNFSCPKLFVQRLDGTVVTPKGKDPENPLVPLTADRDVCAAGRWVQELAWKGGAVGLAPEPDPSAPPPSMPCETGATRRHPS